MERAHTLVQEALLSHSLEGGQGRPNLRRDETDADRHARLVRANWKQLLQKIDNETVGVSWNGYLSRFGPKVPCATTVASQDPVNVHARPELMHDAHVYCIQCRKCFCHPTRKGGTSGPAVSDCFAEVHKNLDPPHQVVDILRRKADILADIKDMLRNLQKDRCVSSSQVFSALIY